MARYICSTVYWHANAALIASRSKTGDPGVEVDAGVDFGDNVAAGSCEDEELESVPNDDVSVSVGKLIKYFIFYIHLGIN